jgi:hypothetical protein
MTGPTSFNLQYHSIAGRLAGPWAMIMHDRGGEAALGPFLLFLLPAFLIRRRDAAMRSASLVGVFTGAYWLLWFLTARDPRFFLPAWPAACALAAAAACGAFTGMLGTCARLACVISAAFAPFYAASLTYRILNPGPVVWGAVPGDAYADRLIPPPGRYAPLARAANLALDARERVLVVGDVKGALLKPWPVYPSMFDTPHLAAWVREADSSRRLMVKFRQHGVRAVFYNPGGAIYLRSHFGHFRYTDAQRRILLGFWERCLEPVHELREGSDLLMGLYRVRARPVPSRSRARGSLLPGDSR